MYAQDMGFVRENPGETLKAQLSTLEEQLKEMHEEDSKKSDRMAVDKIQIEQLKARIAFLDREYEGSKVVSELSLLVEHMLRLCWKICAFVAKYLKIMQYWSTVRLL